jgi:NAD(P)-dependent dehydrogenase (short-subunit alcohol dehydrogenase family)
MNTKTIIVTGGSQGIGAGLVKAFLVTPCSGVVMRWNYGSSGQL